MAIKGFCIYQLGAAVWGARSTRLMVPVTLKHGCWKYMFMQLSDPIPSSEGRKEGRAAGEAHTVPMCQQPLHFIIYWRAQIGGWRGGGDGVCERRNVGKWYPESKTRRGATSCSFPALLIISTSRRESFREGQDAAARVCVCALPKRSLCMCVGGGGICKLWGRDQLSSPHSRARIAYACNLISQMCHKSQDFML